MPKDSSVGTWGSVTDRRCRLCHYAPLAETLVALEPSDSVLAAVDSHRGSVSRSALLVVLHFAVEAAREESLVLETVAQKAVWKVVNTGTCQ
jgi:hypothetical protein